MSSYALELIKKGKRIDGRSFYDFRKIEFKQGVVNKAEGSSLVKFGETQVLCGIKLDLVSPFPDSPNEGILVVNAEFTPLASPEFEVGPPSEDAIELARIVDRAIRESKCIDLESLGLNEEKVWGVFIDIDILNHKGNLLDASSLAALLALENTKIPKVEEGNVVRGEYEKNLPLNFKPITVSIYKIDQNFIIDPILEEEEIASSKISFSIREDDMICAIQKQGSGTIRFEEIEKILDLAYEKSREVRRIVWG